MNFSERLPLEVNFKPLDFKIALKWTELCGKLNKNSNFCWYLRFGLITVGYLCDPAYCFIQTGPSNSKILQVFRRYNRENWFFRNSNFLAWALLFRFESLETFSAPKFSAMNFRDCDLNQEFDSSELIVELHFLFRLKWMWTSFCWLKDLRGMDADSTSTICVNLSGSFVNVQKQILSQNFCAYTSCSKSSWSRARVDHYRRFFSLRVWNSWYDVRSSNLERTVQKICISCCLTNQVCLGKSSSLFYFKRKSTDCRLQLVGATTALSLLTSSKISPVENAKGAKDVPGLHCSDAV